MSIRSRRVVIPAVLMGTICASLFIYAFAKPMMQSPIISDALGVGRMNHCEGNWAALGFLLPGGGITTVDASGVADVVTVLNEANPVPTTTKEIVGLQAIGNHPELGTVTWGIDDRTEPVTTITAASAAADFPASGHIEFYATATIEAYPDQVFQSSSPVVLSSTNINTYPFVNEVFNLETPVDFEDANTGEHQFTLTGLTATLTTRVEGR